MINIFILLMMGLLLILLLLLQAKISITYSRLLETKREISAILQQKKAAGLKTIERYEKQQLAEQVVDKGTSVVETVHKTISGITFGLLEKTPVPRSTSKVIKDIHDKTSDGVYSKIRTINKQIGEVTKDILGSEESDSSSGEGENQNISNDDEK